MKSERIMKLIGLLIIVAAVVMVALYFAGVFNKKTVQAAGANSPVPNNAPGYVPGMRRTDWMGGRTGSMERHILA